MNVNVSLIPNRHSLSLRHPHIFVCSLPVCILLFPFSQKLKRDLTCFLTKIYSPLLHKLEVLTYRLCLCHNLKISPIHVCPLSCVYCVYFLKPLCMHVYNSREFKWVQGIPYTMYAFNLLLNYIWNSKICNLHWNIICK